MRKIAWFLLLIGAPFMSQAQNASEYGGGYKIKFNEDGSKYMRATLYSQFRFMDYEGNNSKDGFSIRRTRVRFYSELGDKLFIMANMGLNNLNDQGLSPSGETKENSIKLMELVIQYSFTPDFQLGAGLHYWNGINRLNSSSSMNSMTLDNNRASVSTMGMTNQLGMNLGVYGKGKFGKFNYRLAINDASVKTNDSGKIDNLKEGQEVYLGKALLGKGHYVYEGYFDYNLLDSESNFLPYYATTYLGAKRIFNIGAGFSQHSNGIVEKVGNDFKSKDATHVAVDAFYDAPIGNDGSALSAYASVQYSKVGDNYLFSDVVGNGNQIYAQVGYLIPKQTVEGVSPYKNRIQPYVSYSQRNFKGLSESAKELRIGSNWFVDGRNAKITVEYQRLLHKQQNNDVFAVQAMIYL